jgi:hypothetical protein
MSEKSDSPKDKKDKPAVRFLNLYRFPSFLARLRRIGFINFDFLPSWHGLLGQDHRRYTRKMLLLVFALICVL